MTEPENEQAESLTEPNASEQIVEAQPATKQTSVARSAGIVSIAVMFSRVFGLVREMIFARYFGAGFLYDAYVVAFRIPNVLRDLFAEGALSAAFVKVFTDYQINKGEKEVGTVIFPRVPDEKSRKPARVTESLKTGFDESQDGDNL